MELRGNQLTFRGNDLEIGIEHKLTVESPSGDGVTLVKAKTIGSIISKLPRQTLEIEVTSDQKMIIHAGKVDFEILCSNPEDYPVFPSIESGIAFQIEPTKLMDYIRYTLFSASFDETKQFLNGVLVKSEAGSLSFVTTDGYRLSLRRDRIEGLTSDFSSIVPYKAMNELSKIVPQLETETPIRMTISENQCSFVVGDLVLVSRVIKGQFPDYNKVLPKTAEHHITVSRRAFLEACERASVIASSSNNVIRMNFGTSSILVRATAPSMGDFKEEIDFVRTSGEGDVRIAFNVKLVLEAVRILESDDIQVNYSNGLSPCVIKATNDDHYLYIIMPIRTSDFEQAEAPKAAAVESSPVPEAETVPNY
jgi:DNA polymerase-3 subunit beta